MFSFYSPLHFLRVEIKKELRQVDYISVDVFTSPRGPPDWLRWLANNLPNNYWPRTTKRNIKKILPTQNKKATRAFHFPNSFSVSWIWLASISQSYRENLMRVFLLLLSFFFLILLPRLCFASFLSFCFFSRLFCVQLAVQQTTFSARDVRLYSFLFSFVRIDVFWYGSRIVEDAHWFAMGNRLSISSSSSCCFLLLPFFIFYLSSRRKRRNEDKQRQNFPLLSWVEWRTVIQVEELSVRERERWK
jgi:hypothetical protein